MYFKSATATNDSQMGPCWHKSPEMLPQMPLIACSQKSPNSHRYKKSTDHFTSCQYLGPHTGRLHLFSFFSNAVKCVKIVITVSLVFLLRSIFSSTFSRVRITFATISIELILSSEFALLAELLSVLLVKLLTMLLAGRPFERFLFFVIIVPGALSHLLSFFLILQIAWSQ